MRQAAAVRKVRIGHSSALMSTDGAPMQKFNDLSRSLTPLKPDGTLIAVIEMSLSSSRCRDCAWRRAPAVEEACHSACARSFRSRPSPIW